MLDLVLGPAGKYACCCLKDVRVCRSAEGAGSVNRHLVTTLMSLHCSGKKQKTAQAPTRAQWTSGPVAESIRRNPTAYQRELSLYRTRYRRREVLRGDRQSHWQSS